MSRGLGVLGFGVGFIKVLSRTTPISHGNKRLNFPIPANLSQKALKVRYWGSKLDPLKEPL